MAEAGILGNLGLFIKSCTDYKSRYEHNPARWDHDKIVRFDPEFLIVKIWQSQAQSPV
jgi:hypothetical protein